MPGLNEVGWLAEWVGEEPDGPGAVGGTDATGNAAGGIDAFMNRTKMLVEILRERWYAQ